MSNDSIIIHGHLLKEAREDLNLSIDDVARRLTLSNKHIISMEENKKDGFVSFQIKLISIRKYASFLELDIDSIIEHTKNKTNCGVVESVDTRGVATVASSGPRNRGESGANRRHPVCSGDLATVAAPEGCMRGRRGLPAYGV